LLEDLAIKGQRDRETSLFGIGIELVQQRLESIDEFVLAAFLLMLVDRCGDCGSPAFFKGCRSAVQLYGEVVRQGKPSFFRDLDLGWLGRSELL